MDINIYKNKVQYPTKSDFILARYSIVDSETHHILVNVVARNICSEIDHKVDLMVTKFLQERDGNEENPIFYSENSSWTWDYPIRERMDLDNLKIMGSDIRYRREKNGKKKQQGRWESFDDSIYIEIKTFFMEKEYKEAQQKHAKGETAMIHEFKADLFKELGIEDNPRREKLWSIAWEKGHSGGLSDIYAQATQMVELIED